MTNAEARFNKSLRPRKPEGLFGRTAQDVHLDSHTAPELWHGGWGRGRLYTYRYTVTDYLSVHHTEFSRPSVSALNVSIMWLFSSTLLCEPVIVQELCESRGGRPGLSVLTSLLVSVDVKIYWIVLRHWSQLVPNMSNDI